ncbi:hypothetical protein GeomeDRAFT_0938 [Geobacter metallireducens RCH3]|uniref:DUF4440 domain-containing protein n=1 Tax=Geobacter metallireducens (strain ATCC 53774 / DSM 7210 / GS-15) TaxID=269799 RepID=Q39YT4_GEOMG|nr:hypothetical protein [Geobacter metallireducens]ABB30590.1 hypothetical protein Gmet_0347 [Geobacter metallireducens GS-15]EHP87976.1 hypothetical protein GeomeDRAFT_0938 [Geobacter metallireducens RCH3]
MHIIRRMVAVAVVMLAVAGPASARTARPADPGMAAEARQSLEDILDTWRDGNYELLYDRTSVSGRESREGFARKLAKASRRPACCWEKLQEVTVSARSGDTVTVRGRFGLDGGPGGTEYATRSVRLVREDGVWKASRADILSLAGEKRRR